MPMHVFALLFAAYFSTLACFTCVEEEEVRSQAGVAYVTAIPHACGMSDLVGDWCSLLSQCHCCPGVTLHQTTPST